VARLEPSLGPVGGPPTPLEGGITNRNFKVSLGGVDYVLRLHGKDTELLGISREAERTANEAAARLGIAPEVAGGFDGGLVTRFLACRQLAAEELAARVEEVARALRAFHDSGTRLPVVFDVPALLRRYAALVRERGGMLPAAYAQAADAAERIVRALPARAPRPCHNDLLAGNLLSDPRGERVMIVDWEYAGMGEPCFDLGNLSVNNGFDEGADARLLAAYHGEQPTPAQVAELRLMRVLSDAREGAWGVMQGLVSDLDFDFGGYARRHFDRLERAVGGPEFDRWLATVGR